MVSSILEAPRLNERPHGGPQTSERPANGSALHSPPASPLRAFDDARQTVHEDDLGKWDVQVRRREVRLRDGQMEFSLRFDEGDETYSERLELTRWAQGQLCARLGIPAAYFRACPLVLQDQNANYWLQEGRAATRQSLTASACSEAHEEAEEPPQQRDRADETWLLRARHGTLRALLSASYSPLDNATLLEHLAPLVQERYRVQWFSLADENLHLRLVQPGAPVQVRPNDDFFAGVHVANSEVGLRAVTVDALVYRLVCSNGLIALVKGKSLLRQRHIHVAQPRFRAALEEAVAQAMQTAEGMLHRLQNAAQETVPDPATAIDRLARRWGVTQDAAELAKSALERESGEVQETAYGLINAFTYAAQTLPDERRYDLEVLAGQLAQHGVPRFALAKEEPPELRPKNGTAHRGTEDIVDFARDTFDAQIVRRTPSSSTTGGGS